MPVHPTPFLPSYVRLVTMTVALVVSLSVMSTHWFHPAFAQPTPSTPGPDSPVSNPTSPVSTASATPGPTTVVPPIAPTIQALPEPTSNNMLEKISISALPPQLGDYGGLRAKPGEKIQAVVQVRNNTNHSLLIKTLIQDFIMEEDGQTPVPVSGEVANRWSLAPWVTFTPTSQVIPAQTTTQVNVLITVPENASPGGHYAQLLHEAIVTDNTNSAIPGAALNATAQGKQQVGTLLYFTVDGPINEEAFIRNFTFPTLSEYGPLPFSFMVENRSDIHIKPTITLDIVNMFGQTIDTLRLEQHDVFPLMNRDYAGEWSRRWGSGRYTAHLTMSYGSQGKVVLASTIFWLFPYKIVLAGGLVLVLAITILALIRQHIRSQLKRESTRIHELESKLHDLE